MKIEEYLSNVAKSGEYLRPHQYLVNITPPVALDISTEKLQRICMNCKSAFVPGTTFQTYDSDLGGQLTRKIAHSKTFTDLPLSFYLSEDQAEKTMFDDWQRMIVGSDAEQRLGYYKDYAAPDLKIDVYSRRADKIIGSYIFYSVWPISVSDVDLSYDANDQFATVDVTMTFRSWKKEA